MTDKGAGEPPTGVVIDPGTSVHCNEAGHITLYSQISQTLPETLM